jgi:RNA polymerase primary sigma factor
LIGELFEQEQKITWTEGLNQLNRAALRSTFEHEILTFDEAKSLSDIYHGLSTTSQFNGTTLDSKSARDILITRNLKLVRKISLSTRNTFRHVEIEDIFQCGTIGLIRAVEKWDPSREFQFSTYATWHIRQSISRFILDNYSTIRIPIYLTDKLSKVKSYLIQYLDFFECEPEVLEAADALEISENDYIQCRAALFTYTSFEVEFENNPTLFETLNYRQGTCEIYADPSIVIELDFLSKELSNALDTLSEREAGVIAMRFGLTDGFCHSLEEIGNVYGVTRERIRQIETKTMSKLRNPARSFLLREYLDFEESQWESKPLKSTRYPSVSSIDLNFDDLESFDVVSPDLYCGGL